MDASNAVTYAGYLQLDRILGAQAPLSPDDLGPQVRAAEHFFIVVHQAFELWFKQELLDLELARAALARDEPELEVALDHLSRVTAIHRLLIQQMVLFDHLPPHTFLAFRPYLGEASGAESAQFRVVEKVLGVRPRTSSPLYDVFARAIERRALSLEQLYQQPARAGALYRVAEALVDISETFWMLTAAHVRIAERTIGARAGTGGTSGVEYLAEALNHKAFPELWDVRTRL